MSRSSYSVAISTRKLLARAFVAFLIGFAFACCVALGAKAAHADEVYIGPAGSAASIESSKERAVPNTATLFVSGKNNQTEARKILDQVNAVRAEAKVNSLTWDYELEKAAMQRAAEIAIYYSHDRPDGTTFSTAYPPDYYYTAENILAASGSMSATSANENWKRSEGHYNNMVYSNYSCMAAASFSIDGVTYWVELFGNPNHSANASTAVDTNKTYTISALAKNLDLSFGKTIASTVKKGASTTYTIVNTNLPLVAASSTWRDYKTTVGNSTFAWSSSNSSIATVDQNGVVIVKAEGRVTITAKNRQLESVVLTATSAIDFGTTGTSTSTVSSGGNTSGSLNNSSSGSNATAASSGKWVKSGSRWWYRYTNGSYAVGLKKIGSATYYFDSNGWMKTGWQHATGNSDWYYFAGSGAMKTGWLKTGGKWYYLNSSGKMLTGKQTISGKNYLLNSSGAMHTGWKQEGSSWYYYNSSGAMAKGWAKVKNKWYYLDPSSGVMKTGLYKVGNSTYYSNSSGKMITGWQKISNKWHYFAGSGAMKTGWLKTGGKWYYLDSDGEMLSGKVLVSGKIYYLRSSGAMVTGWNYEGGGWCYYNRSGAMVMESWISGKYWVGSSGYMATNSWVDNDRYYVGANGAWVKGAKK